MKAFSRVLLLVFALNTACQDDQEVKLSSKELLLKYNWIVFSVEPVGGSEIPEPDIVYVVLNFSETTYSGSDFTGEFYELGDWSLEGDVLTLNEGNAQIIELTKKKFVYEAPDGTMVTRLPIRK